MFHEIIDILSRWGEIDTWIVVTAMLASMSCALPGNFLLIRRQSMMGDALSHTALPGIVLAFLFSQFLLKNGWVSQQAHPGWLHLILLGGAMGMGVFSAVLTEWVRKLGRVEGSAALGVVFTTLFALGLLLIRLYADQVHLDPDCLLYGTIETTVLDTLPNSSIPRAAAVNGGMLAANLLLLLLFYKELKIASFDASLAVSMGVPAQAIYYALMAVTAATLVAAFESVGSILVIAMLIAPPATAHLLTDKLSRMIALSMAAAALAAALGHAAAITLPPTVFVRLGLGRASDASTAGAIAVSSGFLFLLALLLGPRYGLLSRAVQRLRLSLKIAQEDVLGALYRAEESGAAQRLTHSQLLEFAPGGLWLTRWALSRLVRRGELMLAEAGYALTQQGRRAAESLVRSHRLWESYMAKHFDLPEDHLHDSASHVEHFLGADERREMEQELEQPGRDPHGRAIPPEE